MTGNQMPPPPTFELISQNTSYKLELSCSSTNKDSGPDFRVFSVSDKTSFRGVKLQNSLPSVSHLWLKVYDSHQGLI